MLINNITPKQINTFNTNKRGSYLVIGPIGEGAKLKSKFSPATKSSTGDGFDFGATRPTALAAEVTVPATGGRITCTEARLEAAVAAGAGAFGAGMTERRREAILFRQRLN
jgi:hypothetical protein